VFLTNTSREAKYIERQLSGIIDFEAILIERKIENWKVRLVGINNYYKVLNYRKSRESPVSKSIYAVERRSRKKFRDALKASKGAASSRKIWVDSINNDKAFKILTQLKPNYCLVFGTSIIKPRILHIPTDGMINIHFSLLPHYRGSMSEFWQLYYIESDKGFDHLDHGNAVVLDEYELPADRPPSEVVRPPIGDGSFLEQYKLPPGTMLS
jgi:hypothetical protein